MSDHGQPPATEPQAAHEGADSLLAYAARTRAKANDLAAFLEDVAANGAPGPEETMPSETVRDRRLAELDAERGHLA
ncbi:hypothetical protein [Streptomyces sp. NBC_01443]|uniref:hypothetical protein n=1 Tax=Streptomyces sp. NBC_01443 TaxID=2903868 RepID=UPI0022590717|nr:hypothetical protein [Streptomyces sp. NBC_01443]MCX4625326.1 hypothetical protein [Streptomyces sp. NBC_01443]